MSTLKIKSTKEGITYIASKSTVQLAEQLCDYTDSITDLKARLESIKIAKSAIITTNKKLITKLRRLSALVGEYQCDVLEASRPNDKLNELLREVTKL